MELTQQQLSTGGAFSNKGETPAIVPLRFWRNYKPDPADATKLVEEHWVEWAKKGESGQTTQEKVARLAPNARRPGALEWQVIGPAYEAWKAGEEAPVTGTPLYAWAGIPREIVEELRKWRVLSIEDLAQFPDHKLKEIPYPLLRQFRTRAQAYLESKDSAALADGLAQRDKLIAEQQSQMDDMREQMRLMQEKMEELASGQAPAPQKRGPGRPRKTPLADAVGDVLGEEAA